LTLGLDYAVWGMNPFGYHLTSLLLHAANGVLFFLFLHGLLRRARPDEDPRRLGWAAAAGALLFSIHPLRVESVAWITERRDVTSLFFFLLALLAYLRLADQTPGTAAHRKWMALSSLAFAASLFSKATGFTLPAVLLLLDVWPLRRLGPGRTAAVLKEKIPFVVLMAVAILLTLRAQKEAHALYTMESYPLAKSLRMPGYRVSFYVAKSFLPLSLSPLYLRPSGALLPDILGWAFVLGVTTLVLLRRAAMPAATVAWLSFGILISPVSGIFQGGVHFSAGDRYTYLPCLPFAVLAAAGLLAAARRAPPPALVGGTLAVLLTLGVLTWRQSQVWKDSISLWNHALALDPGGYLPYNNRGTAKYEQGDVDGAILDYQASIAARADWEKPWNNLGIARAGRGDHTGAVLAFTRSLEIEPDQTNPYGYRALSRLKTEDFAGARADLDEVLRRSPSALYHVKRAGLRGMEGNLDGAIADCSAALALNPNYADAWVSRGMARLQKGEPAGLEDLRKSLRVAPPDWPQRARIEGLLRSAQPR
ncbi:MAG TPA: tetratricopeptide repeat protein, partial [Planctomycetota bacterium]|nr:tetratricopeptide repeat protein [Planctomycetota bacterium]